MKPWAFTALGVLPLVLMAALSAAPPPGPTLLRLADQTVIPLTDLPERLEDRRIVLVGEHHSDETHHRAQLAVIQTLAMSGIPLAVGLEMFRSDSQADLEAWVQGRLGEHEFQKIYLDNWNFPWALYRPILVFARENRIPLVGLNVPRHITRQVARKGFAALSEDQRRDLPIVSCQVDDRYMRFIRQAYGAHGHGQMDFTHFCEAQLVWDKSMAANALAYLAQHPKTTMVILTGTGHARKGGIPAQLEVLSNVPYMVLLPSVPGDRDRLPLDPEDADYFIQGF